MHSYVCGENTTLVNIYVNIVTKLTTEIPYDKVRLMYTAVWNHRCLT